MGHMKDFDRRIRQGGDDAIAAVAELWESREKILFDITDAFTKARWIPVGERLPANESMVLAWSLSNGLHVAYLDSFRQWRDDDHNPGKKITHWMPIPEPPSP